VNKTDTRLAGLSDAQLIATHNGLDDQVSADAAIIEAHHLVAIEMLKRNIPHGHIDDAWVDAVVLIEKVAVDSPEDIAAPAGIEKAWSQALVKGGTVSVLLTTNGYVLKADPTVSDVHVDAVMGSGRRRKPQANIFDLQKTIKEEDGKFTVYSEDGARKFGTYASLEEAEARLRQIERFSKAEGYSVPSGVQEAAKRAVAWIQDGKAGDGFTSVGRNRASQLASGGVIGQATLVKMRAYFARHGKQRGNHDALVDGEPTPWRVAWDAWGGDAGRAWVNRVLGAVEKRATPEPIIDLHLNLENRQHAIDEYLYGPMNPDEPGDYWDRLGEVWGVSGDEASTTRCGNCAAFNVKSEIKDAMGDAISEEGEEVVDLADLGYCELLQFKCAGSRSCSVWLTGGPISDDFEGSDDEIELLESMDAEDFAEFAAYAYLADEMEEEFEKRGNPEALRDYWRKGGKGKIPWGAGGDFTACVAAVGKYMSSEQAKGYCAIRHREVTGMWPGDKRNRTKKSREATAKFTLPGGATYEYSLPVDFTGDLETILKHGSHDQKAHAGKGGASGDVDPEIAASIVERVRANGGLSVNMVDGSEPPSGYMVARVGVKAAIVDADDFYDTEKGPAALSSFMKDNKAELSGGDYLGVWHDTDGGKVYLDVSQNVASRSTAIRFGEERNQLSIWDVVEGMEIPTGGTGELEKAKAFRGDQVAGSVEDDGRGDRRLRERDLVELQPEINKHLKGKHDQSSHSRGGGRSDTTVQSGGAGAVEYGGYKLNAPDNPAGETAKRGADSIAAAKKERAKVASIEPEITRDMIDVANANGAKMDGLDQRLKSEKSLARKIDDEKDSDFDGDATKTAENMSDVARYTMTYKDSDYVSGANRVVEDLREKGYEMRVKNYWQDGDPYQGINISAVHPNGTKFELQLHTPTSLDFKEPTHAKYDKYRESTSPQVRYKEYTSMRRIARQIPKPPPPDGLSAIGDAKFQPFTPTPESAPVAI
jgi:hypothetical protein